MSVEVHADGHRVVVTLGAAAGGSWSRSLGEQLATHADGGPVVIDVADVALRPDDLRALGSLLDGLDGADVWISCSRLAGRQLLRRHIGRPCAIVRSVLEVPWPTREGAASAEAAPS